MATNRRSRREVKSLSTVARVLCDPFPFIFFPNLFKKLFTLLYFFCLSLKNTFCPYNQLSLLQNLLSIIVVHSFE